MSQALTTGTVVDAVGELGLAPGDGSLQLRTQSIAVAAASRDAAAVEELRRRIADEDWLGARPPLPPLLRRVGALISVAGDGDLDEALRVLEHDALAPAFCRHRIHPLSATATVDVPELIDHHVDAGVDAILIAFGGHLPPVSAWDAAPVLEAIHRAHGAGVPVVAGFAHGRDQPLTKLVAHNHGQASAAVAALVHHNHRLLGRLVPSLTAAVGQVDGAAVRVARTAVLDVERVTAVTAVLAERDPLLARLRAAVDAIGDPGPGLRTGLRDVLVRTDDVVARLGRELATTHDAAGRLPGLLHHGLALVTDVDGRPLPTAGPAAGTRVRITTATTTFGATVDEEHPDD